MVPVFSPHRLLVAAALTLVSFMPLGAFAQTASPEPPARTYFTDGNGNESKAVKERYFEDSNGERNGKYIEYNRKGYVLQSVTYLHGKKHGPAVEYLIDRFSSFTVRDHVADRNAYKSVGNYADGRKTGVWSEYLDGTKLSSKRYYNAAGEQVKYESYDTASGKLVPPRTTSTVPAATNTPAATAPALTNFYAYSAAEKAAFEKTVFNYGAKTATGAELASGTALKTVELCDLIKDNNELTPVRLLLKASKAAGANPTKLIITNAALTIDQLRPLLVLEKPQVDAELLYYGLRGSDEAEKGHGTNLIVQRLIQARGNEPIAYKKELEEHFYRCARAARDAYSNTQSFPLRRWLYDEYKDSDPVKWMNKLTPSDPLSDQKLYLGL